MFAALRASCQEFNITQDPSCLLQIQPGRYGEASGSPTCASSASWTQQLFVEPRPAYPRGGGHQTEAALRGNFALMTWTQIPRLPNTPPVSALIYGLEDSGWQLNANLTALAPQSTTMNWAQAGVHHNTVNVRSMVVGHSDADLSRFGFVNCMTSSPNQPSGFCDFDSQTRSSRHGFRRQVQSRQACHGNMR